LMPMRANIVGPPDVATRISPSIAACHSWASCSAFGSFVNVVAGVLERYQSATLWRRNRSLNLRDQSAFTATKNQRHSWRIASRWGVTTAAHLKRWLLAEARRGLHA